jgi:hypothetical protein
MKRFKISMVIFYQTRHGVNSTPIGYVEWHTDQGIDTAVREALITARNHGFPDADVSGVEVLKGGLQDA